MFRLPDSRFREDLAGGPTASVQKIIAVFFLVRLPPVPRYSRPLSTRVLSSFPGVK